MSPQKKVQKLRQRDDEISPPNLLPILAHSLCTTQIGSFIPTNPMPRAQSLTLLRRNKRTQGSREAPRWWLKPRHVAKRRSHKEFAQAISSCHHAMMKREHSLTTTLPLIADLLKRFEHREDCSAWTRTIRIMFDHCQ